MAKNGIAKGLSDILLQGLGQSTDGGGSSKTAERLQLAALQQSARNAERAAREAEKEANNANKKKGDSGGVGSGVDILNIVTSGGDGAEILTGSDQVDTLFGNGGDDQIIGFDNPTGAETLYGGTGNDVIFGGSGVDSAYGGLGNDTIEGNFGDDYIEGQSGTDLILDGGTGVNFSTSVEKLVSTGPLPGEGLTESSPEHTDELAHGTPLPTGGYVITWGQGIGADQAPTQALKFARFDALGNMIGNPVRFDTLHPGLGPFELKQEAKVIALQGDNAGRFAIVFESEFFSSASDDKGHTYLFVFNADGTYVNSVQLSTNTDQTQVRPTIAATSDGGVLVAWQDNWLDGGGTPPSDFDAGIYMRKYSITGSTISPQGINDIHVNSTNSSQQQTSPEMLTLSNGNVLVAWNSTHNGGSQDVYFRIFNSSGTAITGEIRANTTIANNESISNKNLTNLPNGNWVVVYTSDQQAPIDTQPEDEEDPGDLPRPEGNNGTLFFKVFDTAGNVVVVETAIATGDIQDATVTYLPDGGFFVVWSRDTNLAGGHNQTDYDIFGQRYSASGTAVGTIFQINTASDPTGEAQTPPVAVFDEDQRRPHLMTLPNGTVVITWDSGKDPSVVSSRDEEIVQRILRFGSAGGNDTMLGGSGADIVMAESGNDSLFGGNGEFTDSLFGGSGRDVLNGDSAADSIFGGFGSGSANDSIAAADFVRYADSNAAVNVNLNDGATESGGHAQGDFITGVEHIIGSAFNDSLTGIGTLQAGQEAFAANNSIVGAGGADNVFGLEGNDSLFGDFLPSADLGGGTDSLFGGAGADLMYGGTLNDFLQGGAGADTMSGDAGVDTADYSGAPVNGTTTGVDVNLQAGTGSGSDAAGDVLSAIENVRGSSFGDTITGHDAGTNSGVNVLSGEDGNDFLFGREGNDTLYGAQLTDQLFGGSGFDTLFGGNQNDTLHDGAGGANGVTGTTVVDNFNGDGGEDFVSYLNAALAVTVNLTTNSGTGGDATNDAYSGIEHVIGGNANDILIGEAGGNTLLGLTGNDTLAGLAGGDVLDGGTNTAGTGGGDWVNYAASNAAVTVSLNDAATETGGHAEGDTLVNVENVFGSTAAGDAITGSSGLNSLLGLSGNDFLAGLSGADVLIGADNDDTLEGGSGADTLIGGTGTNDIARYNSSNAAVTVDLTNAAAESGGEAQGDSLVGVEHIFGSSFADLLTGDVNANTLVGRAGNDTLTGQAGADVLLGDVDSLTGSGGDSLFGGNGLDSLLGHDGNDTLDGGSEADVLIGGSGQDWASWLNSSAAVTVDLSDVATESGGEAQGDALSGIEHLIGSSLTDILTGSANGNSIRGAAGDDTIVGGSGGGADAIFGELGDDLLIDVGGTGGDAYDGGKGTGDAISYAGETVGVVVSLLSGVGSVGAATGDTYIAIENIIGSGGSDTLIGNADINTIVAGSSDDTVEGGAANDSLDGGVGTGDWVDYIHSGSGVTVTLGLGTTQVGGDAAGDIIINFENLRGSTQDDTLASALTATISGNNIIDGDQGDDSLIANSGIETFIGGGGSDLVDYRGSDDLVIVNLLSGQGQGGFAEDDFYTTLNGNGSGLENVLGSSFSDTIIGVGGFNTFAGFFGNDVMFGASSRDFLRGDDGDDTLNGGSGGDSIVGGTGTSDFADYTGTNTQGVNVDLSTGRGSGGDAQGGDGFFDTLFGIEHLIGSGNSDSLTGDSGVNWLFGASGNDVLVGGGVIGDTSFHDTIYGGDGNDAMGGRAVGSLDSGVDSLFGGTGNDVVFYDLNDAAIVGGVGNDTLMGNSGADQIQLDAARFNFAGGFADIEFFELGDGNDIFLNTSSVADLVNVGAGLNVFGGSGRDQISMRGVAGAFSGMDDNVDGGAGNDIIWGGFGNDALSGGAGDDQIYGGKGDEKLFGDQGFDVFYVGHDESSVSGTDIIFDDVNEVNGLVLFWGWDSTFGGNFDGLDPSEVTIDYSDPGKVVITMQNGGRVEFERVDNGDGTWSSSIDVLNLWDYGQGEAGNSPTPPTTFGRDVWSATFDASTGQFAAFTLAVNG